MFSALRRLTGFIDVKEQGDYIHISGLPGELVRNDIQKVWGSKKIGNLMFNHMGTSDVTFHRWFAPDVLTTFARIVATGNTKYQIRALSKVHDLMYQETWLKNTILEYPDILDMSALNQLNLTLFPHQTEFLELYNDLVPKWGLTGYLLGAPPGSGKTILGIATQLCRHQDTVVITCPKTAVIDVWAETIKRVFRRTPSFWTSLDGTMPKPGLRYYVVHYDAIERFMAATARFNFHQAGILLDESHKLNEFDTVRTQHFIRLCTEQVGSRDTIWASGTPIKAVGAEATPIFTTIDPMFRNVDVQNRFRQMYTASAHEANQILNARLGKVHFTIPQERFRPEKPHTEIIPVKIPNGEKFTLKAIRVEMKAYIAERVEHYQKNMSSYRDTFHDILDEFEDANYDEGIAARMKQYRKFVKLISSTSNLQQIKDEMKFCNDFEKEVIIPSLDKTDREAFKDAKSVVKYYLLKVQGEALGKVLGAKRSQCIVEMVPHMGLPDLIDHSLSKTLIFTSYVLAVNAAAGFLKDQGYEPLRVFGETNSELPAMVQRLKHDENANPMIATYKTLAEAVPITMASLLITMNDPFRDYEMKQAIARVDRIGQPHPVSVKHIYLDTGEEANISTRSRVILEWSRQQVQEIMGVNLQPALVMEAFKEMYGTHAISMESMVDDQIELMDWEDIDMEALYLPQTEVLSSVFSWGLPSC